MPHFEQLFVTGRRGTSGIDLDRAVYPLRKRAEHDEGQGRGGPFEIIAGPKESELVRLIDQYTATVARADPDPEAASAFIEMAARLVEMKSYLLLPRSEEGERMKQEFTGQLIEYDQCRRMAALLRQKAEAAPVFVRPPMEMEFDNTYDLHHAPQVLADYWAVLSGRTKLRREPTQQQFEPLVTAPMVSVTSRVVYILRHLIAGTAAKMSQLFSRQQTRSTNVATFLALLELVRGGRVKLDDAGRLTMQRGRIQRDKEKE